MTELQVGAAVEHEGLAYVVRAVKKGRVIIADPDGVRETIAVKPGALSLGGGESAPKKKRKASRDPDASPAAARAERNVTTHLNAVLVAETADDGDTWVCPVMDVTMIASHLKLLHGIELRGLEMTEDEMLVHHQELHDAPFSEPKVRHTHQGTGA